MGVEKIKFSWKLYLSFLPEITSDMLKSGNELIFFVYFLYKNGKNEKYFIYFFRFILFVSQFP